LKDATRDSKIPRERRVESRFWLDAPIAVNEIWCFATPGICTFCGFPNTFWTGAADEGDEYMWRISSEVIPRESRSVFWMCIYLVVAGYIFIFTVQLFLSQHRRWGLRLGGFC